MPVFKNCEECGVSFQTIPARVDKRRFCSKNCKAVAQNRRRVADGTWKRPQKPRRGLETPCEVCGKAVYATARQRANGIGRFCSYVCRSASQCKEPVRKNCAHCGKALELRPSQAAIQFCSRECMGHGKTKRPLDRTHNGKRARLDNHGYVMLWEPEHPNKSLKGWVREHVLVAEAKIGRYMEPGEECHHVNGVKDDNRPENIAVLSKNQHATEHAANHWGRLSTQAEQLEEYRKRFGPLT